MSESMAVAESRPEPMKVGLARYKESVAPMVVRGQNVDRLFSMAMMQINSDDKLKQCTLPSIATAVGRIATWGLEPGLTAHLVPYFNKRKNVYECTAMADYKGYVQLMRQCGARDVDAQVVREGDVFHYQLGSHAELRHVPGHTRGKITHAYALVRLAHNVCKFEVMDAAEIDKLRRQFGTPKNKDLAETPEWYARKTVLRRVQKYVPQAGDLGMQLQSAMHDEIDDAEVTPVEGDVTPIGELPARPTVMPLQQLAADFDAPPRNPTPMAYLSEAQLQLADKLLTSSVWTDRERAEFRDDFVRTQAGARVAFECLVRDTKARKNARKPEHLRPIPGDEDPPEPFQDDTDMEDAS